MYSNNITLKWAILPNEYFFYFWYIKYILLVMLL